MTEKLLPCACCNKMTPAIKNPQWYEVAPDRYSICPECAEGNAEYPDEYCESCPTDQDE